MPNFDDPWGSPFGKGKLPMQVRDEAKMRKEERRRREPEIQRGGCGNPNCRQCYNPDGSLTSYGAQYRGDAPPGLRDAMVEEIQRMEERMRRGGRDVSFEINPYFEPTYIGSKPKKPSGPPESYKKAKKAVEKYLQVAPEQAFDDIIGNEDALAMLRDAIEAPVKHKEVYEAYNMKMPKGALLSGPPGCGKTMFARAAAHQMAELYGGDKEFICLAGAELQTPIVGMTEQIIISLFAFAQEYKKYHKRPLLIFIDEAEVILPDRTGSVRNVAPWEESQVATFLAQMDGVVESGAFVLLASNRPETIDQAVLRDGRCDYKVTVKRPNREAVEVILRNNFKGILCAEESEETLVFAALETFLDPHKIILHAHALELDVEGKRVIDLGGKDFCLEHIISGAMAAGLPERAKRIAFHRDKETGEAKGVTVADTIKAVNELFDENKGLRHEYALDEFRAQFSKEMEAVSEAKKGKLN